MPRKPSLTRLELCFIASDYSLSCFRRQSSPRNKELAHLLGIGATVLSRMFKQRVGVPLGEYLRYGQIDYARYLLERTTLTTTRIAYFAGFGTRGSLFRVFGQTLGCTPGSLRDQGTPVARHR